MPKQGHFVAKASRNFGWLRANMNGLMTEANLQRNDGSCEIIGVIKDRSPKAAVITTNAYGDQIVTQRVTFVIATLAILTSALSALSS